MGTGTVHQRLISFLISYEETNKCFDTLKEEISCLESTEQVGKLMGRLEPPVLLHDNAKTL